MAVLDGRIDGSDDEDGVLIDEEIFQLEDEFDIDDSAIPLHLRPLLSAAESGDVNDLRIALDNFNGSIDEPVEDGDTALHLTCLYGYLTCVQLLLERGANLEAKDEDGGIPLHDACAGGHSEIVKELINHASDPEHLKRMLDTVDGDGDTPLHHAARGEYGDVITLLLDHGASPTTTNMDGKTPTELTELGTDARRILEMASSALSIH